MRMARMAGLALGAATLCLPWPTLAGTVMVVSAKGPSAKKYKPGTMIDDAKPVDLKAGDQLIVADDSGTRVFRGAQRISFTRAQEGAGVWQQLKDYFSGGDRGAGKRAGVASLSGEAGGDDLVCQLTGECDASAAPVTERGFSIAKSGERRARAGAVRSGPPPAAAAPKPAVVAPSAPPAGETEAQKMARLTRVGAAIGPASGVSAARSQQYLPFRTNQWPVLGPVCTIGPSRRLRIDLSPEIALPVRKDGPAAKPQAGDDVGTLAYRIGRSLYVSGEALPKAGEQRTIAIDAPPLRGRLTLKGIDLATGSPLDVAQRLVAAGCVNREELLLVKEATLKR